MRRHRMGWCHLLRVWVHLPRTQPALCAVRAWHFSDNGTINCDGDDDEQHAESGGVKPFCAQSSDSWSFKCTWDCCGGCPSCATTTASSTASVTATTTPTVTLATTGTTTTATDQAGSTTPLLQVCKSWCAGTAKPWAKKCKWEKCGGCAECGPPGRRLAAEREHLNDAFFV